MKKIEISIKTLSERIEKLTLCEKFFAVSAGSLKASIPIADNGHFPLLGVFWQQAVVRMSALLSGWLKTTVSYDKNCTPETFLIEFCKQTPRINKDLLQTLIEDALSCWMISKIGMAACLDASIVTRLRNEAEEATDRLVAALL